MAVTIEWSTSSTFTSSTDLISHGNLANGVTGSGTEIFIRHTGVTPLTGCSFYIHPVATGYTGSSSATNDFTEVTTWGAGVTANSFGGIQINMDKTDLYTASYSALSHTHKDEIDSLKVVAFTARLDDGLGAVGVSPSTAVELHENMNLITPGQLPTGATPDVAFKLRIKVPVQEDTAGIRQFDQILRYTYTS